MEDLKKDDNHVMSAAAFLLDHGSDPRTVPALKTTFQRTAQKNSKQLTAMVLLRLGVTDQEYFEYLAGFAKEAVESEAPSFLPSTSAGQLGLPGPRLKVSPAFEAWCIANGSNIDEQIRRQWTEYPNDLRWLVSARDSRAAPIFRKGLSSSNGQIVILSAHGLAEIGDLADIPLLVQASHNPENADQFFSMPLVIYAKRGVAAKEAVLRAIRGTKLYDAYLQAEKTTEESPASKH